MPDPELIFERFSIVAQNELAASAARRVAERPGAVYNPLLIRGGSGVGKTHLLHAIATYAGSLDPDLRIHLDTAEGLAERVTTAIVHGTFNREALPDADILLVDELERISGMGRTQEELAAVTASMARNGKQVVFASRLAPADLERISRSLREALDGGTVVDIDPPDAASRQILAERCAVDLGAVISRDVAQALARFEIHDVRVLRSTVGRLLDLQRSEGRPCSPADVYRIVPDSSTRSTEANEFDSFLSDVSTSLAAIVETAPWRRRIAEAILLWEGEGVRTTRLDEALDADTPPDVDRLLEEFSRAAERLLSIRAELSGLGVDEIIHDPDELARAEELLERSRSQVLSSDGATRPPATPPALPDEGNIDAWFLNGAKVVLDWCDVEGRLADNPR